MKELWQKRLLQLRSYIIDKIVPIVISAILFGGVSFFTAWYMKGLEISALKEEIQRLQNKMPVLPVAVKDEGNNNIIYLHRHKNRDNGKWLEFPIYLDHEEDENRIDVYYWREIWNLEKKQLLTVIKGLQDKVKNLETKEQQIGQE